MRRLTQAASFAGLLALLPAHALAATIFISNERDNTVTVLDSNSLEIVKTIKIGRRPRGIIMAPDYKEVFVALGDDDRIGVIDTEKLEVSRSIESGPDPELMAIDPKGERLYVANEDDALVTVVDRKSGNTIAEISVGLEPEGMRVSPDSKITVATSETTSMAHFIDKTVSSSLPTCSSIRGPARRPSRLTARPCGSRPRSAARSPSLTPRATRW